jgi:hypothetical protein
MSTNSGQRWSPEELEKLRKLYESGVSNRTLHHHLPGRTESSVMGQVAAQKRHWKRKQTQTAAQPALLGAPAFRPNDDALHLRLIITQSRGFPALKPAVAERFYALESAPPRGKEFWRAA